MSPRIESSIGNFSPLGNPFPGELGSKM